MVWARSNIMEGLKSVEWVKARAIIVGVKNLWRGLG